MMLNSRSSSLIKKFSVMFILCAAWVLSTTANAAVQPSTLSHSSHQVDSVKQMTLLTGFHHRRHQHISQWHDRHRWRAHRQNQWYRHNWARHRWNRPYWRHSWPWWQRDSYWRNVAGVAVTVPLAYEAGHWLSHQAESSPAPVIIQQNSVTTGMNYAMGVSTLPANARTIIKEGKTYYQWQDKTYKYDWIKHAYVVVPDGDKTKNAAK